MDGLDDAFILSHDRYPYLDHLPVVLRPEPLGVIHPDLLSVFQVAGPDLTHPRVVAPGYLVDPMEEFGLLSLGEAIKGLLYGKL